MTDDFKCEQCGKCCKSIGLWNVCDNEDWKKIFDYYTNSGEFGIEFKTEGEYKTFLKRTSKGKYKCVLQNIGVKPKICNVYPKNLCNGNKCMRMLNKA